MKRVNKGVTKKTRKLMIRKCYCVIAYVISFHVSEYNVRNLVARKLAKSMKQSPRYDLCLHTDHWSILMNKMIKTEHLICLDGIFFYLRLNKIDINICPHNNKPDSSSISLSIFIFWEEKQTRWMQ